MRKAKNHAFIVTLMLTFALLITPFCKIPAYAANGADITVTAATNSSVKQGENGTCSVNIDSLENLSSLIVTVHYDASKVQVLEGSVENAAPSLLYDKKVNNDSVQFSYIFDGNGNAARTKLFYFEYTVLSTAAIGEAYFDIVVSEAYDSALMAMQVVGSRCTFSILSNPDIVSHSYTRKVIKDAYKKSDATCTSPAIYYYCCETCDAMGDTTFEYGSLKHNYEAVWSYNVLAHWHECTKCDDKTDFSIHTAGAPATENIPQTCTACGFIMTPALGHTHLYSTTWSNDAENHWHSCSSCNSVNDKSAHTYKNACDTNCDVCGYIRTITHSYNTEWSKNAEKHWYECKVCGSKKDESAHTPGEDATETTDQICTVCNSVIKNAWGTAEWENPFKDVTAADWYFDAVKYVNIHKLMSGTSTSTFVPNEKLTRAMFVTILYRLEKEPAVKSNVIFSDVDSNTWYTNAVIWAKEAGIINGVTATEFAPHENITREQIATILHRYSQYKGYDVSIEGNTNIIEYDDAGSISEYAVSAMKYAVGNGLVRGKTSTTLNPKDIATRAEIAIVLQRFIEGTE